MQSKIQEYKRVAQQDEGTVIAQRYPYKPNLDRVESNRHETASKIVDKDK